MHCIVLDALLVVILPQKFGRGESKRAGLAHAVNSRLAKLHYPFREILRALPDVACSSALANAGASELFVDVPDPTPFGET
jgi:hypothetical protein